MNKENSHYGPLVSQHVNTILESGLLLDEDYEVLLKSSAFKIYPSKSGRFPFELIGSALVALGSVFVASRYDCPAVVIPPLIAAISCLYISRRAAGKERGQREIVGKLILSLKKVQKANVTVIRYAKTREEIRQRGDKEKLFLYDENIQEFMNFFRIEYEVFFQIIHDELKYFVYLTEDLLDDFQPLTDIDFKAILQDAINFVSLSSKVQDIYTLLSSKFLNYLGLTFCKSLANINAPQMDFLLNKKLPALDATVDDVAARVRREFNNLRYCTSKKAEIEAKNKRIFPRHVSGKLQNTLIGAVNNLSIIMEKSQALLYKVENAEGENDVAALENALCDLRDHAFATYESLDVLCKLYGILSQSNASTSNVTPKLENMRSNSVKDFETIRHDDLSEACEENYEIFIKDDKDQQSEVKAEMCVDQSAAYLGLMLKELNQSLKQHEKFIAARSKRGLRDEDEELSSKKENPSMEQPKKFDLTALESPLSVPPIPPPRPSKALSSSNPPPPPLPPPVFNLEDFGEGGESKRSFSDNLKALSRQVQGKEEVFGDGKDCPDDNDI